MPASFKVRNVPLDGKNGEFEDVLDPDFGESAIGRVAPVDSGKLCNIELCALSCYVHANRMEVLLLIGVQPVFLCLAFNELLVFYVSLFGKIGPAIIPNTGSCFTFLVYVLY